jgi:hypothetical protein
VWEVRRGKGELRVVSVVQERRGEDRAVQKKTRQEKAV